MRARTGACLFLNLKAEDGNPYSRLPISSRAPVPPRPVAVRMCAPCACCLCAQRNHTLVLFSLTSLPSFVCVHCIAGALVLHRELAAHCAVPHGHDRHDPHPQSSPRHHALQPHPDGRGEGRGARGDGLEGEACGVRWWSTGETPDISVMHCPVVWDGSLCGREWYLAALGHRRRGAKRAYLCSCWFCWCYMA